MTILNVTLEEKAVELGMVDNISFFDNLEYEKICVLGCTSLFDLLRQHESNEAVKDFLIALETEVVDEIRLLPAIEGVMKKLGMLESGFGLSIEISGQKNVSVKAIVDNQDGFAEWFLAKYYERKAVTFLLENIGELEYRFLLWKEKFGISLIDDSDIPF